VARPHSADTHGLAPARRRARTRTPEPDQGTPELRAKRQALVGAGDPALSAHPLGVLLAQGAIDDAHYRAGLRYAFLYGKVFGRTKIVAHYADRYLGTVDYAELDDTQAARFESALRECWRMVAPLGARAKRVLDDIAVYERFVPWILAGGTGQGGQGGQGDRRLLVAALDALAARSRPGAEMAAGSRALAPMARTPMARTPMARTPMARTPMARTTDRS